MATQTIIERTDDLGGKGEATTATFGFGGKVYEIDLNSRNMETFLKRMAQYTEAGRLVNTKAKPARKTDSDATAIRAWAQENGVPVSSRGRVSAEVREAYAAAHVAMAVVNG